MDGVLRNECFGSGRVDAAGVHFAVADGVPGGNSEDMHQGEPHLPHAPLQEKGG